MRERANLRRHVRALSAEGRLSGYVLIGLPLALAAWLFLTDRGYLRPLWTTPFGVLLVIASAVLFVVGVIWMRAAVKVEV
jgi:tight adherence protein B